MQYQISPLTADDAEGMLKCNIAAFADDALHQAFFPKELEHLVPDAEFWQWRIAKQKKHITDPESVGFKVHPVGQPEVLVGYARWFKPGATARKKAADAAARQTCETNGEVHAAAAPNLESHGVEAAAAADQTSPRCNNELLEDFMQTLGAKAEEIWGNEAEYWTLHAFAVHPEHQGHGLARRMMQWGFDKADEDGLPIYLEASPAGDPVYIHFGFKPVGQIEMLEGKETCRVMIRQPRKKA
ncbi:hypothetical protein LTR62_004552 [Meristemomyces frigidus]|uniref:N-acetyltransferase domain-containing protein n=1 Tax=Meristemomyces frigidus TaxID=1508187 RepID=A0AAN7TH30_9PEZI|nr:hypothetical protein LTR62_004552 [Meristemomyces frigidus]